MALQVPGLRCLQLALGALTTFAGLSLRAVGAACGLVLFSAVCHSRYFSALSRGDPLPVKDRIEMPVATQKTDTGLTQGLLKVLHKQVGNPLNCLCFGYHTVPLATLGQLPLVPRPVLPHLRMTLFLGKNPSFSCTDFTFIW